MPTQDSYLVEIAEAGRRLQQSELELYSLTYALSNAFDGTARFDPQGNFLSINDLFSKTFAYLPIDAQELIGTPWQTVIDLSYHSVFNEGIETCKKLGTCHTIVKGHRKDLGLLWLKVALVSIPPLDLNLPCTGFYCFVRDITPEWKMQQRMKQCEEFCSIHNFNIPVSL